MGTFSSIQELFDAFNRQKVLVIGDVMIDAYLWGKVDRISPEAPVPIVAVKKRENRPGGAANVAINIHAMGAAPILCSVIGKDRSGEEFISLMKDLGLTTQGLVTSEERVTTIKTRIIGNNHQLLRVDDEVTAALTEKERTEFLGRIISIIDRQAPSVVVFEDYDKGVLSDTLIEAVVAVCNSRGIPVAVDPKKRNFMSYKDVSLFKPNLLELKEGLKIDFDKTNIDQLEKSTSALRQKNRIGTIMVTLSEQGVFYNNDLGAGIIPAHIRNISDVSGAGDTVISVAALCLPLGVGAAAMAALANLAGGLVCEKVGVVPVDKEKLLKEAANLKL